MRTLLICLAAAAVLAAPSAAAQQQPKLAATPALPTLGQPVKIELRESPWLTYLPGTRYAINGSSITLDYEYVSVGFGPWGPDFGAGQVDLGELPPGNYTVTARMHDIAYPNNPPKTVQTTLAVVPPSAWGIYTVPVQPQAFADTHVMVKSAAYFDPKSMRASVSGNVVRVDFDYRGDAPSSGAAPDGLQAYGSVRIPTLLQPGSYRVEGWGRTNGGPYEKFFERDLVVGAATPVVEYYSASLDHYFMAMGADEIALLDRGAQGDWKRTGQRFNAWTRQADAWPGAVQVCRFYASGPNSHFFTGNRAECDYLKALEQQQRAEANARGARFEGWGYEGIAFYALVPTKGQCPAGSRPVYRVYNGRAAQNDSNHRFTADPAQYAAMMTGWLDESAQFCSPS